VKNQGEPGNQKRQMDNGRKTIKTNMEKVSKSENNRFAKKQAIYSKIKNIK